MDRAVAFGAKGWGFESLRVRVLLFAMKMPGKRLERKKPVYGALAGEGVESTIKRLKGRKLVHKVFRLGWMEKRLSFGGNLGWISKRYGTMVQDASRDPHLIGRKRLQTIPPNQWKMLTFILAGHSVDVINTARRLGIPTPKVFRSVLVDKKYYAIEMSDLSKRGTTIIAGHQLNYAQYQRGISNYEELMRQIWGDVEKLGKAGYVESEKHHPFGGWLIRVNNKTKIAERFLVDATNFVYTKKPEVVKKK